MSRDGSRVPRVGTRVRSFYEGCSFPGYEEFETAHELVEKAKRSVYAALLDDQLPLGVTILDAGCGTGQLATLLSMTHRTVMGIDFSMSSLKKGQAFKTKCGLKQVHFAQMDIFRLGLREESFDYVFCNGVLHHTADAAGGFQALCRLVKPGGYITLGLYNTYGRIMLKLRKALFAVTNGRFRGLDFFMRRDSLGEAKKAIWFRDQYCHPHEDVFTVDQVLKWFARNRIDYVNAIPKINVAESLTPDEQVFERHRRGTPLSHVMTQVGWIFTHGAEGGFFILIGRKPDGKAEVC